MRTHTQSGSKATYNEKKDLLGEGPRHYHDATDVACPHCGAEAGRPCKKPDGKPLHKLTVHMARQDASL